MATILIAEDKADLRDLVKIQLQKHGFSCVEVSDGFAVLPAMIEHTIDLVLMDINMPKMDGWEATTAIRTHGQYQNTPIIALTAYSLAGDRARAKAAGCNAFHCKPIEFDKLLTEIQLLLQQRCEKSSQPMDSE